MLVTFIGSPISGKTTTAAQVFAELKKAGMPAEFVCEIARTFIANFRYNRPGDNVKLDDDDQLDIMSQQYHAELVMAQTVGKEGVVVSDSSALNSLFYMSDKQREHMVAGSPLYQDVIKLYQRPDTLIFFAQPIRIVNPLDNNRVHSLDESTKINEAMYSALVPHGFLFEPFREGNYPISKVKSLNGPPDMRANDVLRNVYRAYTQVTNAESK